MRKSSNKIGIVLGLCCLVLFACLVKYFTREKTAMLNERQKAILEKNDLPTEYEELTQKQRNGIQAIEEFLCYLEEEHPEEIFEFQNYYLAHTEMDERVEVNSSIGQITAYRQKQHGQWVYFDNYSLQCDFIRITDELGKEMDKQFGEGNWRVTPYVHYPKAVFGENVDGRGGMDFLIDIRQGAAVDLEEFVRRFAAIFCEEESYIRLDSDFRLINGTDYDSGDLIAPSKYIEEIGCQIDKETGIWIYRL